MVFMRTPLCLLLGAIVSSCW